MSGVKVGTPPLGIRTNRLRLVDYYTAPWADYPAGTPPVVMVATRELATGQEEVFAWHLEAELAYIPTWDIDARQGELERRVLDKFAERLRSGGKSRWVHWGLDSPTFGFPALAHRAAVAGMAGFSIPTRQYNLDAVLKDLHGEHYVNHSRLQRLIELNGINAHQLLDVHGLTAAFRAGSFRDMAYSLQRKLSCVGQILTLSLAQQLVVDRSRGCGPNKGGGWVACTRHTIATASTQPATDAAPPPEASVQGEEGGDALRPAALPEWVGASFKQHQYKLLKALWGRQEVPLSEVSESVYEDRADHREALDKVKDRTNAKLTQMGKKYEIKTRRGDHLALVPL